MGMAGLFGIGLLFFQNLSLALILSAGGILWPRFKERELRDRRQRELNLQFRDALFALSSALSAGRSLEGAFKTALADLLLVYPDRQTDIIRELEAICRCTEMNEPLERALADFSRRSGLEDVRNFAEVIATCKRYGGNLVEVVRSTAGIIGDKIAIEQEIRLLLAKPRLEQKMLMAMPLVFIVLINAGGGGYCVPLYSSPGGYLLMLLSLALLVMSFLASRKIMDIRV